MMVRMRRARLIFSLQFSIIPEITHLDHLSVDAGEARNIFSGSSHACAEKNVGGEGELHGG